MAVSFEPQPIGRRGTRRGLVVIAAAATLVVLAIAKPWAPATDEGGPRRSPSSGIVAAVASPSRRPSPPPRIAPPPWVTDSRAQVLSVRRAVRPHEGWGVRVLVDGPAGVRPPNAPVGLVELWEAAAPPLPGGIASLGADSADAVVFEPGDRPVRFIGLTLPAGADLRDVRLFVVRPLRRVEPVEANVVDVTRRGQRYVVFGPWTDEAWDPAVYHFRIVLADAETMITVVISGTAPA